MRRTQFITAAIVAAITFFGLHAFVGPRYFGPNGWYGRYGHGYWRHGYYGPGYGAPYRYDRRDDWRNGAAPQQPADSSENRY